MTVGNMPTPDLLRMPQRGKFALLHQSAYPMLVLRQAGRQDYISGVPPQFYLLLAASQACVAKASISTSNVPLGRLHCVSDECVPGWRGVWVARFRESQSARSCR